MVDGRLIVRRPGAGFAVAFLLVAITGALGVITLHRFERATREWVDHVGEDLVLAEQIRANLFARNLTSQSMVLTRDRRLLAELRESHREFDRLVGALQANATSSARQDLLAQLVEEEAKMREVGRESARMVDEGDFEASLQRYITDILPVRVEVEHLASALAQSATENLQQGQAEVTAQTARLTRWAMGVGGLALVLAAGLGLLFTRGLRRFHRTIQTVANDAERGRRQLHAVLSASLDHILLVDRNLGVRFASASALRGMGRTAAEVAGRPLAESGFLDDASAQVLLDVERVIATATPARAQAFLPTAQGFTCFDYEVSPVMDEGRVEAVVMSARDVTDRWRSEEALRDWSNRVVGILESITDAFLAIDRDWRYTYANHEAERLFDRPRSQIEGRLMWELLPELLDTPLEAVFRRSLEQGERADLEEFFEPLGRWLEIHLFPSPTGLSVYFRDITERKRAESHQRLLSASGAVLGASLDLKQVTRRLTRVPLAALADFAVFWPEDGIPNAALEAAHAREDQEGLLAEAVVNCPIWPPESPGADGVTLVERVNGSHLDDWARDLPHRRRLHALEMGSVLRVPLIAASHRVGSLVLGRGRGQPPFDARDVLLAQDFAHRAAMAVKSAALYASSQEAIRSREEVLAVVSHDLRNPLNALKLTAQQLERATDAQLSPARVRRLAERMRTAAERMSRLIRDLLDLAAVQGGALRMERSRHPCAELAGAAVEMARPLAEEKRLELRLELPQDARRAATVYCDRERVLQIFSNLLGNAIRFSPPRAPLVIRVEPLEREVCFSVVDQGPGIPAEQQERIFDRFWRASRKEGGGAAGLGLSIVKSLVEAQGGRVGVESIQGEGSRFFFTLPGAGGAGGLAAPSEPAPTVH